MASTRTYAINLYETFRTVSTKMGTDPLYSSPTARTFVLTTCVLLAGVIKVLNAKGVATDAELNAQFNTIKNAAYPPIGETPTAPDGDDQPAPADPAIPEI